MRGNHADDEPGRITQWLDDEETAAVKRWYEENPAEADALGGRELLDCIGGVVYVFEATEDEMYIAERIC